VLALGPLLGQVLPLICYEAVFPQDVRGAPSRPDWILQVTNDAWFGTYSGPFQHAAQARLRAIESGLPLVRVANTGVTEVIDARGRVLASLPFGTVGHLDAALPGALPPTPYWRWGEVPLLVWLAGCAALVLRRRVIPAA
jgi:apolipoprotein N-acyltransferase